MSISNFPITKTPLGVKILIKPGSGPCWQPPFVKPFK
jgi:hypothetical protein